ncbi:MAG TPA: hypothetical protein VHE83_10285 [Mycobacteriales bacterium]|nr:hypothetical protein [Mycobacteriales bacterium]
MLRSRLLLIAFVVGLSALVPVAPARADVPACTTTFTGAVSNAWDDAANWDHGVPGASSVACWSQPVVLSGGAYTVSFLEGSELSVSGGSLTVTGSYDGGHYPGPEVGTLDIAGGTVSLPSGASLQVPTLDLEGGLLDASAGGSLHVGHLGADGVQQAELRGGTSTIFVHDVDIRSSTFVFGGSPDIVIFGTLTMGPDAVVHHVGTGMAHLRGYGVARWYFQAPESGDFGFPDDAIAIPDLHIPGGATFHAGDLRLSCISAHGTGWCGSISGTGTVDARDIEQQYGQVLMPSKTFPMTGSALVGGTADAPGELHLVGPVRIGAGVEIAPRVDSAAAYGRLVVEGGPVTVAGLANPQLANDARLPGGTQLDLITDADGVVRDGDTVYPQNAFQADATGSTYRVTAADPTTLALAAEPVAGINQGDPIRLTVDVTDPRGDGEPTGTVTVYGCNPFEPLAAASLEGGVAHAEVTASPASNAACTGQANDDQQLTVDYTGDATGTYGHAPAEATILVRHDAPTTAPTVAQVGEPTTTHSCVAPPAPHTRKTTVRRSRPFRLSGQVVLRCNDTPLVREDLPKKTRVDLTHRGKNAFAPGLKIGNLAVDPDQHVHGWVTIPKTVKPGTYAIHVYGASRVLAITVR